MIKLKAREARLLGIDAPTRNELSGPDGGPVSLLASPEARELEDQLNRLTLAEQGEFVRLTTKMDGRGVHEDVETYATPPPR